MNILIAFTSFIILFLTIVELFSILFKLTGLEHAKARFQVISLLTSTGFSTRESEQIVQHPTRRKIASFIMIFGYASTVTLVSFVVQIFKKDTKTLLGMLLVFMVLIISIYILKRTNILDNIESKLEDNIRTNSYWSKFLQRKSEIIQRNKGFGIMEITIDRQHQVVGTSIKNSKLTEKEIQVLSIDKGHTLISFPGKDYLFEEGDVLVVYGNIKKIKSFFLCNKSNLLD